MSSSLSYFESKYQRINAECECQQYRKKMYVLQKELIGVKEESLDYQNKVEELKSSTTDLSEGINQKNSEIDVLKSELIQLKQVVCRQQDEEYANNRIIEILNQELMNALKAQLIASKKRSVSANDDINQLYKMETEREVRRLSDENLALIQANKELSALLLNKRLEEGRLLLAEEDQSYSSSDMEDFSEDQLRNVFSEQQDVNHKLRAYIDGILLKIYESNPQLLEVKYRKK